MLLRITFLMPLMLVLPVHMTAVASAAAEGKNLMAVEKTRFGIMPDGQEVSLYTCRNSRGMVVKLMDYGATLVAVEVPDRAGKRANVTLGFDSLEAYLRHTAYFGCVVGRYANRIANGRITVDGKDYALPLNSGAHHIHGGPQGFSKVVWKGEMVGDLRDPRVRFTYRSADGEQGYPGNVEAQVVYTLTNDNALVIDYSATTDRTTVVNLTNHAYWNLGGAGDGDVLNHELTVLADQYLEADADLIPTGRLLSVRGTPLDFTTPQRIGARIDALKPATGGYDHCYVLPAAGSQDVSRKYVARIKEPKTGRVMELQTTQPGVQLYTANFLDGGAVNGGHGPHAGFCLETQHFPDAPNQAAFPSTLLKPGEAYRQRAAFRFSVEPAAD